MASYAPIAVIFSAVGAVAISLILFWEQFAGFVTRHLAGYSTRLERAAIPVGAGTVARAAIGVVIAVLVPWLLIIYFAHPNMLIDIALLIVFAVVAYFGAEFYINFRIARRLTLFNGQLEIVLRLVVSALRVGLGLRQSIAMVVNEMPEPASTEFRRVLVQTTIGVSMDDALEQLAKRMPSAELTMATKAIRIQTQTGGNLGKVLTNLAEMIKQRRRITRRIAAMTSEAKSTKYIISALPIGVGLFLIVAEHDMRQALTGTVEGIIALGVATLLLIFGWIAFDQMSRLDV